VSPGKPANPLFIIIDTSVLLQLIATDQFALLKFLRSEYKVQSAIVSAVESETLHILTTIRKFRGRQDLFKKAVSNNTIGVIDRELLSTALGTGVDAILRQIDSEGQRFNLRVDRGEAYTHAAGSVLSAPVATNDYSAVNRLLRDDENIPRPLLRFWDLIVFGHQIGQLDDRSCDKIRQTLVSIEEWVPQCFIGRQFSVGLTEFYPRLVDGVASLIGASKPEGRLDDRLVVFR
jgi:hypothetical protein